MIYASKHHSIRAGKTVRIGKTTTPEKTHNTFYLDMAYDFFFLVNDFLKNNKDFILNDNPELLGFMFRKNSFICQRHMGPKNCGFCPMKGKDFCDDTPIQMYDREVKGKKSVDALIFWSEKSMIFIKDRKDQYAVKSLPSF